MVDHSYCIWVWKFIQIYSVYSIDKQNSCSFDFTIQRWLEPQMSMRRNISSYRIAKTVELFHRTKVIQDLVITWLPHFWNPTFLRNW